MELHCPHCSEQIEAEAGDEFCPECGQPIKAALEAAADGSGAAASGLVAAVQGDPGAAHGGAVDPGVAYGEPGAAAGETGAAHGDPAAHGGPAPTPGAQTDPLAGSPSNQPVLLIKVDGRPPVRYTGAPILVGRLDEASGSIPDLPFNDPAISRRHLTVWQEGARIIVQDGSTNGTFRAGLRLPQGAPVELQAGDSLTLPGQMGTYTIRFELA